MGWNTKLLLDPTQHGPISLQHVGSFSQPIRGDHTGRELFEALLKHPLPTIARDDVGMVVQSLSAKAIVFWEIPCVAASRLKLSIQDANPAGS